MMREQRKTQRKRRRGRSRKKVGRRVRKTAGPRQVTSLLHSASSAQATRPPTKRSVTSGLQSWQ